METNTRLDCIEHVVGDNDKVTIDLKNMILTVVEEFDYSKPRIFKIEKMTKSLESGGNKWCEISLNLFLVKVN